MDTSQLLAFQRVVREGTFSRAALTLNIGQPALSARIQSLEAELGGALFTRGRRVALTPLGTSFLPYVRRALETLDEGARVARPAERGTSSCSSSSLLKLRWWQTHDPTLLALAEKAGVSLEVPMEAARCLVRDSTAVGFFPRTYVAEDLARGELVPVRVRDLEPPKRGSALVRRTSETPLSPAGTALVAAIEAQAARLGLGRSRRSAGLTGAWGSSR